MTTPQSTTHHERVIFSLNDHWITIVKPIFILMISWIVFYLSYLLHNFLFTASPELSFILLLITFSALVIIHHWFFLELIKWRISNWYVTNKKIIVLQNGPFVRNDASFINIEEIQETEMRKHGLAQNILDFGDIIINLPATPEPIILANIPSPNKFLHIIEDIKFKKKYLSTDIKTLQKIYGRRYNLLPKEKFK